MALQARRRSSIVPPTAPPHPFVEVWWSLRLENISPMLAFAVEATKLIKIMEEDEVCNHTVSVAVSAWNICDTDAATSTLRAARVT